MRAVDEAVNRLQRSHPAYDFKADTAIWRTWVAHVNSSHQV
jgi:hypothetical protein